MNSFVLLGSISSILSTVSMAISLVVLALVVLGALWALKRGFARSALRLGTVICSIILALIGATFLKDLVGSLLQGLVNDMLSGEGFAAIMDASPTATDLITGLPGALAGPFVFLALFILFNTIFLIVYNILKHIPIFKLTLVNKLVDRLLAAVVGAVCMLLIIC